MLLSVILIISTSPHLDSRSKGVSLKHTDYDKLEQVQSSASSALYHTRCFCWKQHALILPMVRERVTMQQSNSPNGESTGGNGEE